MAALPAPAKTPNTVCPFTGKPIELRQLSGGLLWQGVASDEDGGWMTRLFQSKSELEYFISKRRGVKPAFGKHGPTITVREPSLGLVSPGETAEAKERALDEEAKRLASNIVDAANSGSGVRR